MFQHNILINIFLDFKIIGNIFSSKQLTKLSAASDAPHKYHYIHFMPCTFNSVWILALYHGCFWLHSWFHVANLSHQTPSKRKMLIFNKKTSLFLPCVDLFQKYLHLCGHDWQPFYSANIYVKMQDLRI